MLPLPKITKWPIAVIFRPRYNSEVPPPSFAATERLFLFMHQLFCALCIALAVFLKVT